MSLIAVGNSFLVKVHLDSRMGWVPEISRGEGELIGKNSCESDFTKRYILARQSGML